MVGGAGAAGRCAPGSTQCIIKAWAGAPAAAQGAFLQQIASPRVTGACSSCPFRCIFPGTPNNAPPTPAGP